MHNITTYKEDMQRDLSVLVPRWWYELLLAGQLSHCKPLSKDLSSTGT